MIHQLVAEEWTNATNYWKVYALAPNCVAKPGVGDIKGYSLVFRNNWSTEMFEHLWTVVKEMTLSGDLGYYAGFSDDKRVIAIHYANPDDSVADIEAKLKGIGFHSVRNRTKQFKREAYWLSLLLYKLRHHLI